MMEKQETIVERVINNLLVWDIFRSLRQVRTSFSAEREFRKQMFQFHILKGEDKYYAAVNAESAYVDMMSLDKEVYKDQYKEMFDYVCAWNVVKSKLKTDKDKIEFFVNELLKKEK